MNTLPSATFRTTFHKLTEPTQVTVNGHPIGSWTPFAYPLVPDQPNHHWENAPAPLTGFRSVPDAPTPPKNPIAGMTQAQRDALLRGMNKK